MKLWTFLTTDLRDLNLKRAEEVTKAGTDTAKAVFDLAKAMNEQGSKVEALQPYVGEISSLLDVLNSPLAQVVKDTIPFAPLAIGMLKLIAETTKREPTLEQCMALVSQTAYLDSLRSLLKPYDTKLEKEQKRKSTQVADQLQELGKKEFSHQDAKDALLNFPNSRLAQDFNAILQVRLQESGFSAGEARVLGDRIAWNTDRNIHQALATSADTLKPLAEFHRNGGRELLERYQSIETYLTSQIQPLPDEIIFREDSTEPNALLVKYRELYVPLKGQRLSCDGKKLEDTPLIPLDRWLVSTLNDPATAKHLMFIQGEAGRGKSVFCRMVSAQVYQSLYPSYTPILIRLRGLRTLATQLQDTLESAAELQNCDFVTSDSGWLTDSNTRFLFFLDGFDELLLEGRATGGLKEFLEQVEQFQQNSHHRFVITGRPLALMQVERVISQVRNIERIELQPMDEELLQLWIKKWAAKVGQTQARSFWQCLKAYPDDVQVLAHEPLLIYLSARMHREKRLTVEMFADTTGLPLKIRIYDAAIAWVLEKQRQHENVRLTGLEPAELRQFLTEAATCVVQSGNEIAKVSMLEARLKASHNPAAKLLEKSRQETSLSDSKALNNLLASFYLKPASGEQGGSIEFVHKSFGEFLFAERLLEALEDWTKKGGRRQTSYTVPDTEMHREVYDLLGYGGLTPEIVGYLTPRLVNQLSHDALITLFERLNDFYDRWCESEFIDAEPPTLPQDTMRQLKTQGVATGQRQVDVYTGLNVMILCLELHRYGQSQEDLKAAIVFYPSGQSEEGDEDTDRLLKVIHYSDALSFATFTTIAGSFLTSANLDSANLDSANLDSANLTSANLTRATLTSANLDSADLTSANLTSANLTRAFLTRADLTSADLTSANLTSATLTSADLTSADLTSANLTRATLTSADLTSADLTRATLTRATLDSADLTSADLTSATLDSADLDSADLTSADLTSANLDSATLTRATLTRADLTRATLTRAFLASANLRGADLTHADLTHANLRDIIWNEETKWDRVEGLETARNVPEALKQQLGLA